jgi:di/tricarboxylate transporter
MTTEGWITVATIVIAAILIMSERVRPDVVALLVILTLGISGVLTLEQAIAGFSAGAVITILGVFILTAGLEITGVTSWISRRVLSISGAAERRLIGALSMTSGVMAAFMNTIAAAAVLLPSAMSISRRTQLKPSRLLMPISFGALLGGTLTVLTTANIIVSGTLPNYGLEPFSLFEFIPLGLPLLLFGTLFMILVAPRILPERDVAGQIARMRQLHSELTQLYHLREETCEVLVKPDSQLAGLSLSEAGWGQELGISVLGVLHDEQIFLAPEPDMVIEEGDTLLLNEAPQQELLEIYALQLNDGTQLAEKLASEDTPLIEAILAPRSELEGKTIREINFRKRYGLQIVAIWRERIVMQHRIAEIKLRFGDAMLIQGPREQIERFRLDPNVIILEEEAAEEVNRKAPFAAGILILSIVVAATGLVPIPLAMLGGAVMMVILGCLTMEEAYRSIYWRALIIIAGMLPLSTALQITGTASFLGEQLATFTSGVGAIWAALALILVTLGLSLLVTGQAAAIIMAPIAISTAFAIQADPRTIAMAVAIACSLAFMTPMGHPANLLVMGPGGYTPRDYAKLGAPLTIISILVLLLGLLWIYNL